MYEQFYNFSDRPFQLTPDPRFYFESGTHRKAMSYLGYGLAQGEGFIVITGEVGAGKTTLVAHLMNTIDPERLTAVKLVSTQVEGDDLLRLTARQFGIAAEMMQKSEMLAAMEQFLREQARSGKRTLLIVDEGQNLAVSALEELRMLSNFQLGGQSLLQIFLLGQPEFRDTLFRTPSLEQLRQRVIATHHLDPMESDEVGPYVMHRLGKVGWQGNPEITDHAFHEIYEYSEGVPRRLNVLVSRVLLYGAIEELHRIDGNHVRAVIADMAAENAALAPHPASHQTGAVDHAAPLAPPVETVAAAPEPAPEPAPAPFAHDYAAAAAAPPPAPHVIEEPMMLQTPLSNPPFLAPAAMAPAPVAPAPVAAVAPAFPPPFASPVAAPAPAAPFAAPHAFGHSETDLPPPLDLARSLSAAGMMPSPAAVAPAGPPPFAPPPSAVARPAPAASPLAQSFPPFPAELPPLADRELPVARSLGSMASLAGSAHGSEEDEPLSLRRSDMMPPAAPPAGLPAAPPLAGEDDRIAELNAQIAGLEQRIRDQDVAIRRVLDLLIEWAERDPASAPPARNWAA